MLKRLLNSSEALTDISLRRATDDYGARVFPKVRVADVLPIEGSGIVSELFRYALQAHFDFVVADSDSFPLFAVEFDGPVHITSVVTLRDRKKAQLCERFDFPLLRINARYLRPQYRGMDLLTWCIEVWFLQRGFEAAQAGGDIPHDEPFDPLAIYSMGDKRARFPLWLSLDLLDQWRAWASAGRCLDPGPSYVLGLDGDGNYRALAFTRLTESHGMLARSGMQPQLFPVDLTELLGQLATFELHQEALQVFDGRRRPREVAAIRAQINDFLRKYTFVSGQYTTKGWSPLVPEW